jgi:hypothetical protein
MANKNYDILIKQKAVELQFLSTQLERAREAVLSHCTTFVRGWIHEYIERLVSQQYERTFQLGLDGIRNLKGELASVESELGGLVRSLMEKHVHWHPKVKTGSLHRDEEKKIIRESVENVLRLCVGYAAALLSRHGYSVEDFERDVRMQGEWLFKYGLTWSSEVLTAYQQYEETYERHRNSQEALERLEVERAQNQARSLWESV